MPKRTDIKKILVIGSGPIVIGQACEFDYSGTQAIKALKEEGYTVCLVNSNPATIMTDPELSDKVYVEPLRTQYLEKIIAKEKPCAILPTMGGQTALNLTMRLHEEGILKKYNVEVLGAKPDVIRRAEDRDEFKQTMTSIGIEVARSMMARSLEDADKIIAEIGLPLILRPSFTLGGEGGGISTTRQDFLKKLERALFLSPTRECLIEESLLGWKEFELEVIRDKKDNVIIVCSIENFDPMGVHTGDSITVAPAQTLTDREYQTLRDYSIRIIRAIGVETGGSNIQFALHPESARIICIEMNPRVSRSSALASKATGFPIARVAAKLAIGYTLDELTNDITGSTPCSFEPSIDYVVTKIPRFDFDKFKPTQPVLTTQMKSVGEVMAIGRSFEESLSKAVAGLETIPNWLAPYKTKEEKEKLWEWIEIPNPNRLRAVCELLRSGTPAQQISKRSGIDVWFLTRIMDLLQFEDPILKGGWPPKKQELLNYKQKGWTDRAIGALLEKDEEDVIRLRGEYKIAPSHLSVDTCSAEFEAKTPYLYSSYQGADESKITTRKKVMILGSGPNRIGQGIEFDYCCVHAALALRKIGYETIMVNSNPETVSTDFDTSDKLYFEPVTPEHVMAIADKEKPEGVIVQFGGQTPLKIAKAIERLGLKILGTSTESIDLAEDRKRFDVVVKELAPMGLEAPPSATATSREEALQKAKELGFPLLVRPSYVLGGRGMRIIRNEAMLAQYIDEAILVNENYALFMDRFLDRATEVDVDAISDGKVTFIAGIMEHIEEAGIHSGDSACSLPVFTMSEEICNRIRMYTRELAKRLKVIGLMNVQFAVQKGRVFVLEVNPRGSRTVPFVSKATGVAMVKLAVEVIMGKTLADIGVTKDFDIGLKTFNVKAPVFPFEKFPDVDVLLGPEMKSTGEVMGRASTFPMAYAKALAGAGMMIPKSGAVFLSIRDEDKNDFIPIVKKLLELGFTLSATKGTSTFLTQQGITNSIINKVNEGSPHCVEAIREGKFSLIINTTSDEQAIKDSFSIRRAALERKVPYSTVVASARAMIQAIALQKDGTTEILPL